MIQMQLLQIDISGGSIILHSWLFAKSAGPSWFENGQIICKF